MRLLDILGMRKSLLRKRILTLGVIITGSLSIAFALITFYGQNAGNFVMTVDQDLGRRGIMISDDPLFRAPTTRLMTDPVTNARDITYSWIKIPEILQTDGQFYDPDYKYIAYTFYLQNTGSEVVDIAYHIRISDVYKGMDEAVRFLVIEDDTTFLLYQKPDRPDGFGNMPEYFQLPTPIHFLDPFTVCRNNIDNFRPGEVKKFTIIIWLEGQDPDTNNDILGGMLKAHMNFIIRDLD